MRQPNIVFIMTDQQRLDTLGCCGNKTVDTPVLDRLAAEGVLFDQFYVNNPVCVPSRCSFLTGRYPNVHRSRDLSYALDPGETHLFRLLKEAGYRIGLSGKNHALSHNELELFDFLFEKGHEKTKMHSSKPYASQTDSTPEEEYTTTLLTDAAIRFIKENADTPEQPFCLWLSYPDPHTPFEVPEPFASIADRSRVRLPVDRELDDRKPLSQRLIRDLQDVKSARDEELVEMIAIYHGMVKMIDESVGKLLHTVQALGLEDNTIVVFTSDHGEYLGDHEMVRKSLHFYDCLMRVPFIISWKNRIKPQRVSETMAESVDLLPTLLDLAGITKPERIQGSSLYPLLNGQISTHKCRVYAESGNPGDTLQFSSVEEWKSAHPRPMPFWFIGAVQGNMLRTLEWKLCLYANGEGELYHLTEDPDETNNLFGVSEYSGVQLELTNRLVIQMLRSQNPDRPNGNVFDLKHA